MENFRFSGEVAYIECIWYNASRQNRVLVINLSLLINFEVFEVFLNKSCIVMAVFVYYFNALRNTLKYLPIKASESYLLH